MSSCPWCGADDVIVKGNAFMNADIYQNTNLVVTKCCNQPVTVTPLRTYQIAKYLGNRTEDDWGNDIDQPIKDMPMPDVAKPPKVPTAADARKALRTLALYYGRTPAIEADASLVKELDRKLADVVGDWFKALTS